MSKPLTLEALQARAEKLPLDLPPVTADVLRQKCIAIERTEQQDRREVGSQVDLLNRKAVAVVLQGGDTDFGAVSALEAELAVRSSHRQRELAALREALARETEQGDVRKKALEALRDEVASIARDAMALQAQALHTFREALRLEESARYRARLAAGGDARRVASPAEHDPRLCMPKGLFTIENWFDTAKRDGYDGPR
jgi:hypothetical protein